MHKYEILPMFFMVVFSNVGESGMANKPNKAEPVLLENSMSQAKLHVLPSIVGCQIGIGSA